MPISNKKNLFNKRYLLSEIQIEIRSSAFLMLIERPTAFGSSKFSLIIDRTKSCHILPRILTPLSLFFLIFKIQKPPLGKDSHIGAILAPSLKR